METSLLLYILLLPLAGAVINGIISFFGKDMEKYAVRRLSWSHETFLHRTSVVSAVVGVGAIFTSFAIGISCYLKLCGISNVVERKLSLMLFTWIQSGSLQLDFGLQFDPLSAIMVLVVTGIGALIHLYSVGYMHGDPGFCRYFCYLNFFIFAMLVLVLGSNLVVLFVGWEGVGLASYLLIGFWYTDLEKSKAGKKAFITNRIGDLGFVLGMLLIFALCKRLNFDKVTLSFDQIAGLVNILVNSGPGASFYLTIAALLLFFGACGKSAQIPLYVWLPDAMAGPTPVSALIHAATMVTAGVYMMVRLNVLYFASPSAMMVIAVIGAATALFAATIALVQNDIKKVLAYSTISQLGYMFLACGVGAPILAMFHLVTHAFFKACLFLGAGSVIHGMGGEQDIQKMGGLRKKMPATFWTFIIASFAIAGFPPLSGFVSKDEIMAFAFGSSVNGSLLLWTLAAIAALCTSFYTFRLCYLTFLGESRSSEDVMHHVHESPFVMTIVLKILAVLAIFGSVLGVPHFYGLGIHNYIEEWLRPVVSGAHMVVKEGSHVEIILLAVSFLIALTGLIMAGCLYGRKTNLPDRISSKFLKTHHVLLNKYFVDEIYRKLIVDFLYQISLRIFFRVIDKTCIDGLVNFSGRACRWISGHIVKLQQGDVQYYVLYIVIGSVVFSAVIFFSVVIR